MKRFYNLLSFFLLSLVGITNAVAQDYGQGKLLETPEQIVGKDVLLYEPGTSDDHPAGYLNGSAKWTNTISDACIYNFIKLDKLSEDGHPLYLLQQKSTGKYVMDPAKIEGAEDESYVTYTSKKEDAFEMTVLNFVEVADGVEADLRTQANSNKQDLSETGFVLCRNEFDIDEETGEKSPVYIAGQWEPSYFPYPDTNVFRIYEFVVLKGQDKLMAYVEAFVVDPNNYTTGTTPGTYKKELVDAAENAYNAANKALEGTVTDEQADKLCADLKKAYNDLMEKGFNALVDGGYYFIHTTTNHWMTSEKKSGLDFLWGAGGVYEGDKAPAAGEVQVADAKYIWKLTSAGKKDLYYVQNLYTGTYMSAVTNAAFKVDKDCYILTEEKTPLFVSFDGTENKNNPAAKKLGFVFYQMKADSTKGRQFHSKFANSGVFEWNDIANPNNIYLFNDVAKADIDRIAAEVEQAKLNEKLNTIYGKALVDYSGSLAISGGTKDADFSNGLTKDSTNFFCTVLQSNEGKIAALADGKFGKNNDVNSYFHTSWSGGQFKPSLDRYHYVGVDLKKEISGGIMVKIAKRRTYNDYPMEFAFFGSNDPKAVRDSAEWTLLGCGKVDWSIGMPLKAGVDPDCEKDTVIPNAIGVAGTTFEGSYRYIKCAAIATQYNINDPIATRGFFCLSEMTVYSPATIDPNGGLIQQVSEPVRKEIAAALEAAKKEVAAGKATQPTIDRLQKAYDAFMKELPNPQALLDAAKEAKTFANNVEKQGFVGEELAQYAPAGLEALKAAVKAANEYDANGKSAKEILAEVEKLNTAVATFKEGINLPEADKIYRLRGASRKAWNKKLISYKAQCYAKNNGNANTIYFTYPEGATNEAIVTNDNGVIADNEVWETVTSALTDTLNSALTNYYWYVEKAEKGKIVLRNVGTGMYLSAQNGEVGQSVTPVEIPVILSKPLTFVFDAGKDKQLNVNSNGQMVTWADPNDWNAQFTFEAVPQIDYAQLAMPVANEAYQIVTLPVTVDAYCVQGTAYSLVGETDDKKFALAEITEPIPAGTPFILGRDVENAEQALENGAALFDYGMDAITNVSELQYSTKALDANGIQGTLCEVDTVAAGYAYLRGSKVVATKNTVIGVNSGYFNAKHEKGVAAGDVNLELGKVVVDNITNADVVVLPSVVDVYSVDGVLVRKNVKAANATKGLPAGVYVVGKVKVLVK